MLIRLTKNDGSFGELTSEWAAQCEKYDEDLATYAAPHLELAEKVCSEDPQDLKYGIYALASGENGDKYQCLMHANVARLPQTDGKTLRLLWILLAPKYDFEDIDRAVLSKLSTEIVLGAIKLASESYAAQIKVHLGSIGERQYFTGFCAAITAGKVVKEADIRGNWLHLTP